ncbi:phosphotransferase [Sphingomonas sp. CGMCC 1.13654]|uniref:Phosphotransferase n=1 Tax=Sphingomonas chungangi TaxID=2683589 RepID=A0A838L2R6_9SPHN|nr:phosphotransferase [Sphingomonas chungangi]MBA2933783.1 phosphotransferase [Sphingomonas chungangi]MVW55113.1 phosphotransferase [Sphingomonas chungangi]
MSAALNLRGQDDTPAFAHDFARSAGGCVRHASRLAGGSSRTIWSFEVEGAAKTWPFVLHQESGLGPFFGTRFSLSREAATLRALRAASQPVPRVHAVSPAGDAMISDCLPGRANFTFADGASRLATIDDFARRLAALHACDPRTLDLPWPVANTRAEATLANLDDHEDAYRLTGYREPPVEAAFAWLRSAWSPQETPPAMLQGDAGPTNFIHADGRLTGFIDWEMAHAGDPHDDLAWVWFRVAMLGFDSDVRPWFDAYQRHSGVAIEAAKLDIFIVAVMLRCTIANIVRRHNDRTPSTNRIAKTVAWLEAALTRAQGRDTGTLPPRGLEAA